MNEDQNKIHETELDLMRQERIIRKFCAKKSWVYLATPRLSEIDYDLFDGKIKVALAEVKHRTTEASRYPTYTVDCSKIDYLVAEAFLQGVEAYLIVGWTTDTRYVQLTDSLVKTFKASQQKRQDRNEKADLVYHIPVSLFIPTYDK